MLSLVLPQLGAILDLRQLVYICVSCSCLLGLQGRHLNCRKFCRRTLKRLLAASAWCIYQRLLTSQQNWHNGPDTSCTAEYKVWCLSFSSPFWGKVWAVPAFFPTLFVEPSELFVNACLSPLVHNLVTLKDDAVNCGCSGVVQWVRAPSIWSKCCLFCEEGDLWQQYLILLQTDLLEFTNNLSYGQNLLAYLLGMS